MKLLPCPFCGGEAEIERYGDRSQSTIYACTMCGCRLETGEEWDHGADWNRRYNKEPEPDLNEEIQKEIDREILESIKLTGE
jgi:Lar family restriction alleviation protein